MRRAIRKATKKIQLQILDASGGGHDTQSMLSAAAVMMSDMVRDVCQALQALQEVQDLIAECPFNSWSRSSLQVMEDSGLVNTLQGF